MITNKMHVQKIYYFFDGRVWTSLSAITYLVSSIIRFKMYDGKIDLIQAIFSLPIVRPFTWVVYYQAKELSLLIVAPL